MLKIRIIPILLLKGNSIVKSVSFENHRMIGDAVTAVKVFSNRKADELIILDIEAYKNGIQFDLLSRLSSYSFMPLTIGGGIKSVDDVKRIFNNGADKVTVNSLYFEDQSIVRKIVSTFGSQAVCLSLDVKKINNEYKVFYNSGNSKSKISLENALEQAENIGIGEILINSIDQDGRMNGLDQNLIKASRNITNLPLIACGGCGGLNDFALSIDNAANAVAAGSIFHWKGESIITIKEYLYSKGYNVRVDA